MSLSSLEDRPSSGAPDGLLTRGLHAWKHLHALGLCSNLLLNVVQNGLRLNLIRPLSRPIILPELPHPPVELEFLLAETEALLTAGAIELCPNPVVVCPVFAVPKKRAPGDDRPPFRMVHNLRTVNNLLWPVNHYRLAKVEDIPPLLSSGCLTAAIDIEAAYHHIKIDPASRPLLAFSLDGQTYQWTVCPFGLSHSAYYWVMTSKALVAWIHHHGIKAVMYCDDLLAVCSQDEYELILKLLRNLGVNVSVPKLQPPSHETVFLGHVVRTPPLEPPTISLTPARTKSSRRAATSLIKAARAGTPVPRRALARHLGTLASTATVVPSTHLLLRPIHQLMTGLPAKAWDVSVALDESIVPGLEAWLLCRRLRPCRPLLQPRPAAQITTDASHLAWGAVLVIPSEDLTLSTAGSWSDVPPPLPHITQLESMAVDRAARLWAPHLHNRPVIVRSDATVVVHSLKRMVSGSVQIAELFSRLSMDVLEPLNISVSTTHLAGVLNTRADAASRLEYLRLDKHDYILRPQLALALVHEHCPLGMTPVDRFASDVNALLPTYNARRSVQPGVVDAFLEPPQSWTSHFNYLFPPCSTPVITRLLSALVTLPEWQGLLVLPRWPGAPWWPLLLGLPSLSHLRDLPHDAFLPGLSGSTGPCSGRWTMCVWIKLSDPSTSHGPADLC